MPNLESCIAQWRQALGAKPQLTSETVDELEAHLRERIAALIESGLSETDACHRAIADFGTPDAIATEFRKLAPASWLPVKIVTSLGFAIAVVLAILLIVVFTRHRGSVLLAVHVFTVTLGYGSTLLLGLLGACFVIQRALVGFSSRRLGALGRVTLPFAIVATICTVVGIILGMVWSHREWGRFWSWDAREMGALCVLVWMAGFLIIHRFRWVTTRGLLVASVLGSNVTVLAWFGPALSSGLHAYGLHHTGWLLVFVAALILNLLLTLLGLAPAGCLRSRKA